MLLTGEASSLPGLWADELGEASRPASRSTPYLFKVSPLWLIIAYVVVTLGELMLSPMGLSLVSKVAPDPAARPDDGRLVRGHGHRQQADGHRRLLGRLAAVYFFFLLAGMALVMGVVLLILLRPLKKAMPGV